MEKKTPLSERASEAKSRHYVIAFEHAGHHHIIAWDDNHRFEAGATLGRMVRVPEFDLDPVQMWQVAIEMKDLQQQGSDE